MHKSKIYVDRVATINGEDIKGVFCSLVGHLSFTCNITDVSDVMNILDDVVIADKLYHIYSIEPKVRTTNIIFHLYEP